MWFWSLLFLMLSSSAFAKLILPTGLTTNDRQAALEILGYGSAPKILGNPYTLGGYSGAEVGVTTEIIPTSDISRLGTKASQQQGETSYSVFTLGKGIYSNLDTYLQFGLLGGAESISNVGVQLRWSFFQAEYLPAFMTAVLSAGAVNFQNLISTSTQASDLILGVSVDDVTLYLGAGLVKAQGFFTGGAGGITDTGDSLKESVSGGHYLAGLNLKFSTAFIAMEIDRYTQSTYSAKLGFRF
jgi:hypothetical protein